jgi:hypothetical protein
MAETYGADYADLLALEKGQGDPLGLAAMNERLYNKVFPGYNNVVRHIRVYSALCWMAERVHESYLSDPPANSTKAAERMTLAMQKMELALLWANEGALKGLGVAGVDREFPQDNRTQPLVFSAWDSKATLMAAAAYGPSISSGFQFMKGDNVCEVAGKQLAQAFDAALEPGLASSWLRDVNKLQTTRSQVQKIASALDLAAPSKLEQQAFMRSFFPRKRPSTDESQANRWTSLHLTLATIQKLPAGAATQAEIRAAMARGLTPEGTSVVEEGMETMQVAWAVLQLRQLQRLALETLYGLVLAWTSAHHRRGLFATDCVDDLRVAALAHYQANQLLATAELERRFTALRRNRHTLYEAASMSDEPGADVFDGIVRMQSRRPAIWGAGHGEAAAEAINALTFCAVETGNLLAQPHPAALLKELAADRCSLTSLEASLRTFRSKPLGAWVEFLVGQWVMVRYAEVTSSRGAAQNGHLRFAFTVGDRGLELCGPRAEPFKPSISQDKLFHTLLLLEQSGLVRSSPSNFGEVYSLTADGRSRTANHDRDRTS